MSKLRLIGISISLMLLALSFFSVTAQRGGGGLAPNPTAVPTAIPDNDGDGIPNSIDNCPNRAGLTSNGGCPEGNGNNGGGNNDDNNNGRGDSGGGNNGGGATDTDGDGRGDSSDDCPTVVGVADNNGCPPEPCTGQTATPSCDPFVPPVFPTIGCFVSPKSSIAVNVRTEMDLNADTLGVIEVGALIEAEILLAPDGSLWAHILDTATITLANPAHAGKEGYAFLDVLLYSNCPIPAYTAVGQDSAGDFQTEDLPLCYMSFGFDASVWSDFYPEMGNVHYASFWFAFAPGEEIPAGTMVWDVIAVEAFIALPYAATSVAVLTDPAIYEEAQNAPDGGEYGWPTLAHGIQSGDVVLARLTNNVGAVGDGTGRCGPIVAGEINDLAVAPTEVPSAEIQLPISGLACTVVAGLGSNTLGIFAFNRAEGEQIPVGEAPIAVIDAPNANAEFTEIATASHWTAERYMGENPIADGFMHFTTEGFGMYLYRFAGAAGGTCGPIVPVNAEHSDDGTDTTSQSNHPAGANFVFADGSVRFVRDTGEGFEECTEGWVYDIYQGLRSDVFYCASNGLTTQANNGSSAAPTVNPIECPEEWVSDIYENERADVFYCTPTSLSSNTGSSQAGLGLECPEGWIHDVYETDVSNIFYCRPSGLASNAQAEIQDDVIVDGRIITAENFDGFGIECPTTWIYDIYQGDRSDVFYCAPTSLANTP